MAYSETLADGGSEPWSLTGEFVYYTCMLIVLCTFFARVALSMATPPPPKRRKVDPNSTRTRPGGNVVVQGSSKACCFFWCKSHEHTQHFTPLVWGTTKGGESYKGSVRLSRCGSVDERTAILLGPGGWAGQASGPRWKTCSDPDKDVRFCKAHLRVPIGLPANRGVKLTLDNFCPHDIDPIFLRHAGCVWDENWKHVKMRDQTAAEDAERLGGENYASPPPGESVRSPQAKRATARRIAISEGAAAVEAGTARITEAARAMAFNHPDVVQLLEEKDARIEELEMHVRALTENAVLHGQLTINMLLAPGNEWLCKYLTGQYHVQLYMIIRCVTSYTVHGILTVAYQKYLFTIVVPPL